jgi:hypothetical protein
VSVHAVEEERDPAKAAFRQRDLQFGEALERAAQHEIGRSHRRELLRREDDEMVDPRA